MADNSPACQEPSLRPDASSDQRCDAVVAADDKCLAHLSADARATYLAGLEALSPLRCRGVVFTAELLAQLLQASAVPVVGEDETDAKAHIGAADFAGAVFTESASFRDVTFTEGAQFSGVTFAEGADFSGVRFTEVADFSGATFTKVADFIGVMFVGAAEFIGASMAGSVVMRCSAKSLDFGGSVVSGELSVEAAAAQVSCRDMRATGRVALRLRGAEVDAENAVFAGPFTVHGLQSPVQWIDEAHLPREGDGVRRTGVVSLRAVDADRLVLTDVDLSRCRFAGIHRLDQIVLDGRCTFAADPSGSRLLLAEEHHWRATRPGRRAARWMAAPDRVDEVGPERLEVIYRQLRKAFEEAKNEPGAAGFYYGEMQMRRAAATRGRDRWLLNAYWATSGYTLRVRRALAWLALVVAATITALTLWGFPAEGKDLNAAGTLATPAGTAQPIKVTVHQSDPAKKLPERISKATEITLNAVIFRNADADLTTAGRYIDVAARILGPLFLGFSLLALRNRVKR